VGLTHSGFDTQRPGLDVKRQGLLAAPDAQPAGPVSRPLATPQGDQAHGAFWWFTGASHRLSDRSPEDDDLASQPTLSHFENANSIRSLKRLRDVFLTGILQAECVARLGLPQRIPDRNWTVARPWRADALAGG
jgi:hypothetical protein